jgi:hypothetical protein
MGEEGIQQENRTPAMGINMSGHPKRPQNGAETSE